MERDNLSMNFNWPLIGHSHIKKYFEKAFISGKIHHAYLFEGPEHVGKLTFAGILTKTLLCKDDTTVPCGICQTCDAFEHGAHPDFLTLRTDEKEHLSIEEIRGFIGSLHTRPLLSTFRIGIIEEAERLTVEASNALLKTLEEPGPAVVLFLIANRPVLPTISSRTQRIQFGFSKSSEIEAQLRDTPYKEEIARLSGGRPGNALTLKDKEVYEEYKRSAKDILDLLTLDQKGRFLKIVGMFSQGDTAHEKRIALRKIIVVLEVVLRDCLTQQSGANRSLQHLHLEADIIRSAKQMGLPQILGMFSRLNQGREFLGANVDPRIILEYILLSNDRI